MRSSKCMKLPTPFNPSPPLNIPDYTTFPADDVNRIRMYIYYIYIHIHTHTHTHTQVLDHPTTIDREMTRSDNGSRGFIVYPCIYYPLHVTVLCLTHRNPKLFCKITPLGLYFLLVFFFCLLWSIYYFNSVFKFISLCAYIRLGIASLVRDVILL